MHHNLNVVPLGGLEEIGKNCTFLEHNNEIIIIDFGIKFNKNKTIGNLVYYPDFRYLEKNKKIIKGILITHGHLDHIGGLPYLFKKIKTTIFTSKFTKELILNLFQKNNLSTPSIKIINGNFKIGSFDITAICLKHSIVDSIGFYIKAKQKSIFITGDFKDINEKQLSLLKQKKIDLLLSDSTNANKDKTRVSEKDIFNNLESIIRKSNRVFIAHFSTQIYIIKNILEIASKQK